MSNPAPSAPPVVQRRPLIDVESPAALRRVTAQEIVLPPGATVPRHTHPCAVVGYVVSGTIRYARERGADVVLRAGDAFHEPPDVVVTHFDNASATEPATFVAFYLTERDGPTIVIAE